MTVSATMFLDAIFLVMISISVFVLLAEDCWFRHWPMRPIGVAFGISSFAQSMWLLGVWTPSSSGFPLPRIVFDVLLFAIVAVRVFAVLADKYRSFSRHHVRGAQRAR